MKRNLFLLAILPFSLAVALCACGSLRALVNLSKDIHRRKNAELRLTGTNGFRCNRQRNFDWQQFFD